MMNKNIDYKRTEGKGYYENKEDKDHKVYVYDGNIHYSYMDPQFGFEGGCRTTSKDKFLKHFVFMQLGRY